MKQRGSGPLQRVWFLAAMVALVAAAATSLSIARAPIPLEAPAGASPLLPVATITLDLTGSTKAFHFDPNTPGNASDDEVQTLTPNKCVIGSSGASLVLLGGPAGTFDNGMGVYGGAAAGGRGTPCSRVGNGQALTWTLDHANPVLAGLHAMAGYADIEAKGNVVVQAELFLGSTSVATSKLYTGESVSSAPDGAATCNGGSSDSGSDSGPSDNCPFVLAEAGDGILFDRVVFTAVDGIGEFSVDDGEDWGSAADSNRTYLVLTDAGVLDCGDSFGDAGVAAAVSASRLDNADDSTCVAILYRLDIDSGVNFVKDPTFQTTAAYIFDLVWTQESATYPIDPTRIVFDTAPVPSPLPPAGEEGVEIQICEGQPQKVDGTNVDGSLRYVDTDGNDPDVARLVGIDTTPNDPHATTQPTNRLDMVPASRSGFDEYFEYACVLHEETTYLGADTMVVQQRIYVTGDLRMLR